MINVNIGFHDIKNKVNIESKIGSLAKAEDFNIIN